MLLERRFQGPLSTSREDPGNDVGAPPLLGFAPYHDRPVLPDSRQTCFVGSQPV